MKIFFVSDSGSGAHFLKKKKEHIKGEKSYLSRSSDTFFNDVVKGVC